MQENVITFEVRPVTGALGSGQAFDYIVTVTAPGQQTEVHKYRQQPGTTAPVVRVDGTVVSLNFTEGETGGPGLEK